MSGDEPDASFLQCVLATVLEASEEGVIVLDAASRCRLMGRSAAEMFGVEAAACVGKPGVDVLEALSKACEDPDAFWRAAAAPLGAPAADVEVDLRRPRARTILCRAVAMVGEPAGGAGREDREGKPAGRVLFLRDVTRDRAAESSTRQLRARMRALMPFDALTGLLNQRRLYEELGREHSRSTRAWDSYALLRLEADGLRSVHDDLGASAGDQVLEQIARRLEACVREYDVLARLDGDEFGVLLPGADAVGARAVADRMARAVSEAAFVIRGPFPPRSLLAGDEAGGGRLGEAAPAAARVDRSERSLAEPRSVTLSAGIALWTPPSREGAEAIFRRAGEALREAHRQGPGNLCLLAASAEVERGKTKQTPE